MKMVKNATTALVSIAAVVAMTACSSDSDTPFVSGKLATGGFTKYVGNPATNLYSGLIDTAPTTRVQYMYDAPSVDGSGYISEISFMYNADLPADVTCPDMTINMGHTTLADMTDTFANNVEQGAGTFETVRGTDAMTFIAGSRGDLHTITLDTPFHYNGTDNLVVEFDRVAACDGIFQEITNYVTPVAAVWTGTDGSLTGSTGAWRVDLAFNFAGGVNAQMMEGSAMGDGTILGSASRVQVINTAEDINGSGPITGLAYQVNALTVATEHNITVRLGHTALDSFVGGNVLDDNYVGSSVTVSENVVLTIPANLNVGEWFWIPLSGNFKYNGTDNLIVDIHGLSAPAAMNSVQMFTALADTLNFSSDGTDSAGVYPYHHNIKLRFNGAPMSVVETNLAAYTIPLNSTGQGGQFIYGGHVLGTAAKLDSISFRVAQDVATDMTFTDVNITIGHTTLSDLTATLADNMDEAKAVFRGDITVPAGTKAGDWITVPTTRFTYDPTKNLTIQIDPVSTSFDLLLYYGGNGVVSNSGSYFAGSPTIGGFEGSRHPHLQLGFTK